MSQGSIIGGTPSRFAGISRSLALAIVALFIALSALGLRSDPVSHETKAGPKPKFSIGTKVDERDEDLLLYNAINDDVRSGKGYYESAAKEQREGNYPLKPFITFRLPTLAMLATTFGALPVQLLCWGLVIAAIFAWRRQFTPGTASPRYPLFGTGLLAIGLGVSVRPDLVVLHEIWGGVLITLSLGLYRPQRWLPSVLVGFAAVAIRETTLPFILLMGAFALYHRRWREMFSWGAVALFSVSYLAWHAGQVAAVVTPQDPASQGWVAFAGWTQFIDYVRNTTILRMLPAWCAALLVPLSLLGLLSSRAHHALVMALLILGYSIIFMTIGRPENFYWGLLIAPIALIGLLFVPRAIQDLASALRLVKPPLSV